MTTCRRFYFGHDVVKLCKKEVTTVVYRAESDFWTEFYIELNALWVRNIGSRCINWQFLISARVALKTMTFNERPAPNRCLVQLFEEGFQR